MTTRPRPVIRRKRSKLNEDAADRKRPSGRGMRVAGRAYFSAFDPPASAKSCANARESITRIERGVGVLDDRWRAGSSQLGV